MAEIPVQKKSSMTWLWVLLALILLALLIWWATSGDDEADLDQPVAVEETFDDDADFAMAEDPTLAQILATPDQYFGSEYSGEVAVGDSLTDRGFWIENGGDRMFALIIDEPLEVPLDINAGQQLRISGGMIRDAASLSDVEGETLDADTRAILDDQDVVLVVDEVNIEILQ